MNKLFAMCLLTLGLSSAAQADVILSFQGTTPSQDVPLTANGVMFGTMPVGPFMFETQPGSDLFSGTVRAFCADLFQGVSVGTTYNYQPVSIASLPDFGGSAEKVNLVQRLFDNYYDIATDATNGGAFQLVLWEILYDDANNLDIDSGNLFVPGNSSLSSVTTARSWINQLSGPTDPNYVPVLELTGLFSKSAQDQITVTPPTNPIPAPAGLVLGLFGASVLGLRRWKAKTA